MRKPIIAGNWKMNKTPSEAKELVSALVPLVKDAKCDVVVCTPAVDFVAVNEVIQGTNIKLGAFQGKRCLYRRTEHGYAEGSRRGICDYRTQRASSVLW